MTSEENRPWPLWVPLCLSVALILAVGYAANHFIDIAQTSLDQHLHPQSDVVNVLILELTTVRSGAAVIAAIAGYADEQTGKALAGTAAFAAFAMAAFALTTFHFHLGW